MPPTTTRRRPTRRSPCSSNGSPTPGSSTPARPNVGHRRGDDRVLRRAGRGTAVVRRLLRRPGAVARQHQRRRRGPDGGGRCPTTTRSRRPRPRRPPGCSTWGRPRTWSRPGWSRSTTPTRSCSTSSSASSARPTPPPASRVRSPRTSAITVPTIPELTGVSLPDLSSMIPQIDVHATPDLGVGDTSGRLDLGISSNMFGIPIDFDIVAAARPHRQLARVHRLQHRGRAGVGPRSRGRAAGRRRRPRLIATDGCQQDRTVHAGALRLRRAGSDVGAHLVQDVLDLGGDVDGEDLGAVGVEVEAVARDAPAWPCRRAGRRRARPSRRCARQSASTCR